MLKYSPAMATLYSNTILRHRRSHLHILQTSLLINNYIPKSQHPLLWTQRIRPLNRSVRTKHKRVRRALNDESDWMIFLCLVCAGHPTTYVLTVKLFKTTPLLRTNPWVIQVLTTMEPNGSSIWRLHWREGRDVTTHEPYSVLCWCCVPGQANTSGRFLTQG